MKYIWKSRQKNQHLWNTHEKVGITKWWKCEFSKIKSECGPTPKIDWLLLPLTLHPCNTFLCQGNLIIKYAWTIAEHLCSCFMASLKITISTLMIDGKRTENCCPSFILPNYSEWWNLLPPKETSEDSRYSLVANYFTFYYQLYCRQFPWKQ